MNIDEFIRLVKSEAAVTLRRTVPIPPAGFFEQVAGSGIRLVDYVAASKLWPAEERTFTYGHLLGEPSSIAAIDGWNTRHSPYSLPHDLVQLLLRIDGVHLWADVTNGRAYIGLACLEEWDIARVKMWGPSAEPSWLDDRYVAITYATNNDSFVVLDLQSRRYFLMDVCGADTTCPIADSASELLAWLWRNRLSPSGS